MDRAFLSGALGSAPIAPASPSIGYPTEGNPGTGTPPTKPGPWWYHMITEELRGLIAAAGLTPSQNDLTQLLQALPGALASRPEMARSLAAVGFQKLPGGLILQWGRAGVAASSSLVVNLPLAFPSNFFVALAQSNTAGMLAGSTPGHAIGRLGLTQVNLQNCYSSSVLEVGWLAIGN